MSSNDDKAVDELKKLIHRLCSADMRYVEATQQWMLWNGTVWAKATQKEVQAFIDGRLRKHFGLAYYRPEEFKQ